MGLVTSVVLPNNGDRIKVENYNDPIQKIIAQLNGNLDSTNIASLSGSKISSGSLPVSGLADDVAAGWFPSSDPLTYGSNNGSREFTVTIANADRTSKYSPGMRIKVGRSTAPATKCISLVAASSQSATKSSPSNLAFTTAFTVEAWVYLNSIGSTQTIVGRGDNPFQNGWFLRVDSTGRLAIGYASANNATTLSSYQSLPVKRWVHVAGVISSVSGKTGAIYINGTLVPSSLTASSSTALTQTGDLAVGKLGTGNADYFDGYLSEVRVWPNAQSQSQILSNMAINLTGSEGMSTLIRGDNNFNDLTSNANNLTANNSASAAQASNPLNSTEYGIITKVAYSSPNTTITIFTGTDYTIPNGALSNFNFSAQKVPYGFPAERSKWVADIFIFNTTGVQTGAAAAWTQMTGTDILVPTGQWRMRYSMITTGSITTTAAQAYALQLSPSGVTPSLETTYAQSQCFQWKDNTNSGFLVGTSRGECSPTLTSATTIRLWAIHVNGTSSNIYMERSPAHIAAECAYL